jgi:uncharacterized protein YdeI (YjbR/CyaY-like superfamily)
MDIPKDFSDALKKADLSEFFAAYPPSHRREHLRVIADAKKPETRQNRIQKAVTMIAAKRAAKAAK